MTEENVGPAGEWPVDGGVLLEAAPNGVLVADGTGWIRILNSEVERLFGYERLELVGSLVENLVPEGLRSAHHEHCQFYNRHPALRPMGLGLSLVGRRKDASEFPVEISLSPVTTQQGGFVIAVIRDVSDRLRLEAERNALSVELETERERQRIGMDLHDGIMQDVYTLGLRLELALEALEEQPEDAKASIERTVAGLQGVISNIRGYIFDLRPRELGTDFRQALSDLGREVQQTANADIAVDIPTNLPEIPLEPSIMLYHIAHEALSNVRKHAAASEVSLRVASENDGLILEVKDNGRGFDPNEELPESHRGVRNMSARASRVGAKLTIESDPQEGTTVSVRLPLGQV